jgi:hypothetical protein
MTALSLILLVLAGLCYKYKIVSVTMDYLKARKVNQLEQQNEELDEDIEVMAVLPYRELAEIPDVEPPEIEPIEPPKKLTLKERKKEAINAIIEKVLLIKEWVKVTDTSYKHDNILIVHTNVTIREATDGEYYHGEYSSGTLAQYSYAFSLTVKGKEIGSYKYFQEGLATHGEEGDKRVKTIYATAKAFVDAIERDKEYERQRIRDKKAAEEERKRLTLEVSILDDINNSLNV